jgi:hypothetical protein
MKTTIELPDALAAEAKELARVEQSTLREFVIAGLRSEIARRRHTPAVDFRFPTVGGQGLAIGLSPADAIAASYDLPA